jgi:hypothetical protein
MNTETLVSQALISKFGIAEAREAVRDYAIAVDPPISLKEFFLSWQVIAEPFIKKPEKNTSPETVARPSTEESKLALLVNNDQKHLESLRVKGLETWIDTRLEHSPNSKVFVGILFDRNSQQYIVDPLLKVSLYCDYRAYCEAENLPMMKPERFYSQISQVCQCRLLNSAIRLNGNSTPYLAGVRLKKEDSEVPTVVPAVEAEVPSLPAMTSYSQVKYFYLKYVDQILYLMYISNIPEIKVKQLCEKAEQMYAFSEEECQVYPEAHQNIVWRYGYIRAMRYLQDTLGYVENLKSARNGYTHKYKLTQKGINAAGELRAKIANDPGLLPFKPTAYTGKKVV